MSSQSIQVYIRSTFLSRIHPVLTGSFHFTKHCICHFNCNKTVRAVTAGLFMSAIVIDGKGHVEGKLAAAVAKGLLEGKKIVVVRCEDIVTNGDHRFNYHKYRRYLNKTTNSNPRDGPFHQRAPSEMFRKAVRGMCNYKTARGGAAFNRLKVFEGVPPKYEKAPKLVIPHALRVVPPRQAGHIARQACDHIRLEVRQRREVAGAREARARKGVPQPAEGEGPEEGARDRRREQAAR